MNKVQLIDNYSERSFIVIGETYPIKDKLKQLGGSFNTALKHNGLIVVGWVFSIKRLEHIRTFINSFIAPVQIEQPVKVVLPEVKPLPVIEVKKEVEQVKPISVVKTNFKMLVKLSGFVDMQKEFTNEKELTKFLVDIKERRVKAVHNALGLFGNVKSMFEWYKYELPKLTEDEQEAFNNAETNEDRLKAIRPIFEKYAVPHLKIEFTNLNK